MMKWAICKNGLLPNGPRWADSENFLVRRVTDTQGTQYTGG